MRSRVLQRAEVAEAASEAGGVLLCPTVGGGGDVVEEGAGGTDELHGVEAIRRIFTEARKDRTDNRRFSLTKKLMYDSIKEAATT